MASDASRSLRTKVRSGVRRRFLMSCCVIVLPPWVTRPLARLVQNARARARRSRPPCWKNRWSSAASTASTRALGAAVSRIGRKSSPGWSRPPVSTSPSSAALSASLPSRVTRVIRSPWTSRPTRPPPSRRTISQLPPARRNCPRCVGTLRVSTYPRRPRGAGELGHAHVRSAGERLPGRVDHDGVPALESFEPPELDRRVDDHGQHEDEHESGEPQGQGGRPSVADDFHRITRNQSPCQAAAIGPPHASPNVAIPLCSPYAQKLRVGSDVRTGRT